MILGFALVLTLLQVGVSFAQPLNQADLNGLEQSVDKLQNFFHKVRATKQREFASQQHLPRDRPALSLARLQADLNNLEQSVDELVRATNQHEFTSQQHRPRCPTTTVTVPQLEATPQAVYIKDRHSGLVLQYKPTHDYEVVIENYNSANVYQQWYVIQSNFSEYYYIANSTDWYMKVIAAGDNSGTPLYLEPMHSGLDRKQLWIFRQPADAVTTPNAYFMVINAKTGLAMNVMGADTAPGTYVQVYTPDSGHNEQFYFF